MAKRLNEREAKFIAFYLADPEQNATQSAIKAGYSQKSAPSIGWQLLQKPKVKRAIDNYLEQKTTELPKEKFIDLAIKDYKSLDVTEPNKPRFLDIAGKALGYIGANQEKPNQTLNVLNINIEGAKTREQMIDTCRRLLEEQ
jgi:hypothetical protein